MLMLDVSLCLIQVAMSKFDEGSYIDYNKMADNIRVVRDR